MPKHLQIAGGSLSYSVAGTGQPIVFVSGLGGHGAYWTAQAAAFSSSHQTVVFDHRGVGGSQGAPPYSVEQWADDTVALMDHLDLGRVYLVGHSTGGAIAQVVAARNPDRVAALVLGGTWARADERFRQLFAFRKRVLHEMGAQAYEALGETLTLAASLPQRESPPDSRLARQPSPDVVAARIDALLAYDAGDRLRRIRCPTLILAAADDILVPRQLSEVLLGEIAGARLAILESGGHHFPRTRADAYDTLLRDFFEAVPKEASGG